MLTKERLLLKLNNRRALARQLCTLYVCHPLQPPPGDSDSVPLVNVALHSSEKKTPKNIASEHNPVIVFVNNLNRKTI